ncbi:unnamed protein product [Cylindrotheca closterium]|uniref:Uncharacterized protein n=1 Tax=Cylindrotheca closterium TaxID=2856 RepID=A0AAD2FM01_9STRA|nr:unnamed protein product [Cylindrotheca closterium]
MNFENPNISNRSVMITSPEYITAKAANGANSSAAYFIQWLRTQTGNPEVNLHYTVLSYEMTPTNGDLVQGTISNPKAEVPGDNPVATSHTPSISADPITQREDLHSIVQPTNVAKLSVDKLVEGNSMVSRDRNRSLFILAQQHKQRAKVLSHFSQLRPNEKATPTKDKMRKPTPLQIVSPPPMGPGGLAATRQAVHAAAAPMMKQQFGRFTSTLTVMDQLTRTEFIHNQREAIEAKAIKAVCSKFVRAKAMPGGVGDTTKLCGVEYQAMNFKHLVTPTIPSKCSLDSFTDNGATPSTETCIQAAKDFKHLVTPTIPSKCSLDSFTDNGATPSTETCTQAAKDFKHLVTPTIPSKCSLDSFTDNGATPSTETCTQAESHLN